MVKLSKTRLKAIDAHLIAGRVLRILGENDLLARSKPCGMQSWNGKRVMVYQFTPLSLEEQEDLERQIMEQIEIIL